MCAGVLSVICAEAAPLEVDQDLVPAAAALLAALASTHPDCADVALAVATEVLAGHGALTAAALLSTGAAKLQHAIAPLLAHDLPHEPTRVRVAAAALNASPQLTAAAAASQRCVSALVRNAAASGDVAATAASSVVRLLHNAPAAAASSILSCNGVPALVAVAGTATTPRKCAALRTPRCQPFCLPCTMMLRLSHVCRRREPLLLWLSLFVRARAGTC